MALDREIQRWSGFARALRKDDREAFDQLIDICRNYASAGSNAVCPVFFEAMVMCILLDQQKFLNRLKKEYETRTQSNRH
jgi:hypothetical protein